MLIHLTKITIRGKYIVTAMAKIYFQNTCSFEFIMISMSQRNINLKGRDNLQHVGSGT
jgi:hypothetical protein